MKTVEISNLMRDLGVFLIGLALMTCAVKYCFAPKTELQKMQDEVTKSFAERLKNPGRTP